MEKIEKIEEIEEIEKIWAFATVSQMEAHYSCWHRAYLLSWVEFRQQP